MTHISSLRTACLAGALVVAGCSRPTEKVTIDLKRPSQGTPVATYRGGVITVEEVNKALAQMPPMVRMRYQSPAQKKDFIERLARLDLLAREAARRGHANDPDVVESLKNVLAQKLVKDELEGKPAAVSDEELQTWYDAHLAEFTRPETIRVSTIFLAVPEHDDAKAKTQQAKADKLLAQAQKLKADDFTGFGQLAKTNSEDASRALEGDLRALTVADLTNRYGAEVAQAALALKAPGDLSGVVHSRNGLHILKLRAHTPPSQAALAEVKGQIKTRLLNERRNQAYEKFLADLKTQASFQIDEAAMAKILIDPNPKAGEAPTPRVMATDPGRPPAPAPTPVPAPPPARQ
jgi:peptidyl-prolyl cis-trans isomerase C